MHKTIVCPASRRPGSENAALSRVPLGLGTSLRTRALLRGAGELSFSAPASAPISIQPSILPPTADTVPPSAITNLEAAQGAGTGVDLQWTAPGDDGMIGTASVYDIRYATVPMSTETFPSAIPVSNEPAPAPSGTIRRMTFTGLEANRTYYFAMRTADDAANWSGLSNLVSCTTASGRDTVPPGPVTDLAVAWTSCTGFVLTWTSPGNDGSIGTASTYDLRYATAPIDSTNVDEAMRAPGLPAPRSAGSSQNVVVCERQPATAYYFILRASDKSGNWSPISNAASGTTVAYLPPAPGVTDLAATSTGAHSIGLTWSVVSNDSGHSGPVVYDVRYSPMALTPASWHDAMQASGEPSPSGKGAKEKFTVCEVDPGQAHFFAVKVGLENGGWTVMSNVTTAMTAPDDPKRRDPTESGTGSNGPDQAMVPPWETAAVQAQAPLVPGVVGPYPNPSAGGVTIELTLDRPQRVRAILFDLRGRKLAVLEDAPLLAGVHALTYDPQRSSGRPLASGVYLLRIETERDRWVRKLLIRR